MTSPAADPLPEPDHEYGYSESLLEGVLGDHMARFHEYMMMKTYAIGAVGPVYYPHDVRRFVDYYVTRTARPLSEAEVRAVFDLWAAQKRNAAPVEDEK
jgi:hypothetical protein